MLNRLRKLWRNDRGVSAIEFALLAPMLVMLFIGCTEVTFKIWSTQKGEKLSVTLSDVVAQSQNVSCVDLQGLVGSVDKIMDPFPFGNNGRVYISSVYVTQGDTVPKLNWQYKSPSGLNVPSKIGETINSAVTLPSGFTMAEKDNVIVAEVFYKYEPIAPGFMFDEQVIYRRALFKPRLGALTTLGGASGGKCS
jgi:Flp pilus assembly pilin Flp